MAFFTRVFAFSQVVPPRRSTGGRAAPVYFCTEIEALDRHEQLVFAGVAQLHEFLRRFPDGHAQLFEPDEHADAVIDVDHVVADLQIPKIGDEDLGSRSPPLGLGGPALLLEHIGFGKDGEAAFRQPEPAIEMADRDEQRGRVCVLGAERGRGDDLIFLGELEQPLGTAWRRGYEDGDVSGASPVANRGKEVLQATLELRDRLAAHFVRVNLIDRQLLQSDGTGQPRVDRVDVDEQPIWRRDLRRRDAACRSDAGGQRLMTRRNLVREFRGRGASLIAFDDDVGHGTTVSEVVEDVAFEDDIRIRRRLRLADALADRHDVRLVDGTARALRGRVESAERLDRVADELDADWLVVAWREDIDDAAADAELAVLVHGVLSCIAGGDQLRGEALRLDIDAGSQIDRRLRQLFGADQFRQERRR